MALLVVGALVVWGLTRPVHVTVDGVATTVEARSTLADLQSKGVVDVQAGALLSVRGEVIQPHGGAPGIVIRNGRPAPLEERVFEGDVIVSQNGADRTESRTTRREYVPMPVSVEGTGPVVALRRLGSPGLIEITTGKVSGVEASRTVIVTADKMVVVRRPATAADKLVALTFDDGPYPGQTEKILAVLKRENVRATFFMLGSKVRSSPGLVSKVATEGHVIGTHSYDHVELTKLKPAAIRKDIAAGINAIVSVTGTRPVWFRPPYGDVNGTVRAQARALNVKVALWDIDTLDWTRPGVHMLYRNAVRSTTRGDIVLMHDGGGDRKQTIDALPIIIRDLRSKGFTFVTLDELAAAKQR